jgi:phosphate regulon transcriptional regulator PhoB
MAPKVLVVDDEAELVALVRFHFEREGFVVVEAEDGDEALRRFAEESPDLVILDVMLPQRDGLDVCRRIRRQSDVPVILLTAKGEEADRVAGLDLGADDYVTKPFSVRELLARARAVLRRRREKSEEVLKSRNLVLDRAAHEVRVDGQEIPLTATEFGLLETMLAAQGRVFTREQLLEVVWGGTYFGDLRTVDVHIRHLREKLQAAGAECRIDTVRGVGYRIPREP